MFIRNAWYVAAWADEISDRPMARRICNEPVVLYRDATGKAAALIDMCCHRGAPLSVGCVVEEGLQCGYHGLIFDTNGACVRIPGQDRISERARVRCFPLVEQDAFLWIWMGDPALADPAKIVPWPYHNDAVNWPHKHTMYPIKSAAMLMVDNLMDLTHLGYVHVSTIGGNPSQHVEAKMETERTPLGLKFTRWMLNSVPPPTYVKAVGFQDRIDRCQRFEFVAPGSVLQWTGAVDAGGYRDGDTSNSKLAFRLFHGLTPETETSCFYFWSAANGFRQNDPAATEQFFDQVAAAFLEDKIVVEAQQARLSEMGEASLIDITTDAARLHMRRTVDRLIEEILVSWRRNRPMWVRNAWYVAAWSHEVADDGLLARTIMNEPLVLYRTSNGSVVAMEDRCCHRLAPLSMGRREGDDLRCMYHGLKFGPDGRCNEIPGQTTIPVKAVLRGYPVVERGSWIWVWMGEAARADVSQIPETVAASDPNWNVGMGCLDYAANYQLINDNLLDLSHLAFVHEKTLGRGTPQWATEQPIRTRLDRGVRFQRWFRGRGPSHYFGKTGECYDMWHSYDFLVPGLFIQRPAWYSLGTADRYDGKAPAEEPLFVRCDDQAVIPVTDRTSRYFYSAGGRSKDASAELAGEIFRFTEVAFHEDKVIIEAQQNNINQDPGRQMLSLSMDGGPNLFRGIVRELIAAETSIAGGAETARAG